MTGISEAEYHNDPERALRRIDEKKLNFGFVIRPFENKTSRERYNVSERIA